MALKQQLGLRQRLGLTAQMRQSIDVLGMSWAELVETARREAADNPFFGWREPEPVRIDASTSAYDVSLEQTAAEVDPRSDILQQIRLHDAPESHRRAAATLVGWLDGSGYLREPLSEIAESTGLDPDTLTAGHHILRSCDPPGIGAKDLRDCLTMQMQAAGFSLNELAGAFDHPQALGSDDGHALADACGLTVDRAGDLLRALHESTPEPLGIHTGSTAPVLRADVEILLRDDGVLRAQLAGDRSPSVWIENAHGAAQGDKLTLWIGRARTLANAIANRNTTLLAVTGAILDRQGAWFLNSAAPLEPMRMADIAADLGCHPSTVTRALAGKSFFCTRGVIPFRAVFSTAVETRHGTISADAISLRIKQMIHDESPTAPLSDQAIAEKLHADGVDISRRTVAKYRQCMKLPSTRKRRQRPRADLANPNRNQEVKL